MAETVDAVALLAEEIGYSLSDGTYTWREVTYTRDQLARQIATHLLALPIEDRMVAVGMMEVKAVDIDPRHTDTVWMPRPPPRPSV